MFWGQLATLQARREYPCSGFDCRDPIPIGARYVGLISATTRGKFTRHLHTSCLIAYLDEAEIGRKEKIKEKQAAHPGPQRKPLLSALTDTARARRRLLLKYTVYDRQRLERWLREDNQMRVQLAKRQLAKHLQELVDEQLPFQFRFGETVKQLVRMGRDPYLTVEDIEESDTNNGQAAIELLSRTAVVKPVTQQAEENKLDELQQALEALGRK